MIQILFVIGIFAMLALGWDRIETMIDERGQAKVAMQVCNTDKASLSKTIEDQNVGIKKASDDEKLRAKAADEAIDAAKKEAAKNRQTALSLLAAQIPAGKNVCEAARDLMADYARGRGK